MATKAPKVQWTKTERERLLTIIETTVLVVGALIAAWMLDVDIDKIASISAANWTLIAVGGGGVVVALRNAFRGNVADRAAAPASLGLRAVALGDDDDHDDDETPPSGTEGSVALGLLTWIGLVGSALVLASMLSGCSPSALRVHAGIASTVGAIVDEACQQVERDRTAGSDACAREPSADADAACVAAVRARYEAPLAGCELAADVHDDWCAGLVQAEASDGDFTLADGLPWVTRFLEAAGDLVRLLEAVGVDVDLPPELAALLGGE